jgi:hypothetical protein
MDDWRVTRIGHACRGKENTRMNNDIRDSLSRKRLTVSLEFIPTRGKGFLEENPQ